MTGRSFLRALESSASARDIMAAWQALDDRSRAQVARYRFGSGETPLHVAAACGFNALVMPLVQAGADVDARGPDFFTPLHTALRHGHRALADLLLDHGADINAYVARGLTALHMAVLARQGAAVAWLLERGADVRCPSRDMMTDGMTALHMAAGSTPDILRLMLEAQTGEALGDLYYKGMVAHDVLRGVLAQQRADLLDVLIDYGVNVNAHGPDGLTPVQFLLRHRTSKEGSIGLLRRLHEARADVVQPGTGGGETLLMAAADAGWTEAFDYLLAAGASLAGRQRDGATLLHLAARGMQHDLFLRVLQTTPQDINRRNRLGQTPLWLAAQNNRRDNVAALLAAGADPTIPDNKNRTPDLVCQGPLQRAAHQAVTDAQRAWRDSARPRRDLRRAAVIRRRRGNEGFYSSKPG